MKYSYEKNGECTADTETLIKRYKVRATGNARSTIETTIPRAAFEREMRRLGLIPEEALKKSCSRMEI